jgi:hypothetical protein
MMDGRTYGNGRDAPFWLDSACLEKLLEHRFVAELTTKLWLDGIRDFEVLRSEVDCHGYDLVVQARGITRHIQLKAMAVGGQRRRVNVNTRLVTKPCGCVIWMIYDPDTLRLGPFLWFGSEPNQPLPPLGDRMAKHTKGNAAGVKAEKPGHRLIPKSSFSKLPDMHSLCGVLFCGSQAA